ncbi:MAG: NUDIX hydrolase [Cyanobacteria bacterium P01_G01_bin.67]
MGVGCLLFNIEAKLLLLKPTYKDNWLFPGGVIEANESLRQACIREVREEMGIECQPERLLCIDYVSKTENNNESVQFVFWSGIIADSAEIILAPKEICMYQFWELEEAIGKLGIHSQRRLHRCMKDWHSKTTIYLEDGQLP